MDRARIRAFIDANRPIAEVQRQRWDGVDPTRLLEACDLLEQAIAAPQSATSASADGQVFKPLYHPAQGQSLAVEPVELAMWDFQPIPRGQELRMTLIVPGLTAAASQSLLGALSFLSTFSPLSMRLTRR